MQTATYSGPVGSDRGTHRHRAENLVVHTPVPTRLGFAPRAGRVEVTLRASADPDCMTAIWLVGTEHQDPRECGEICVAEIDADTVRLRTRTRCGINAHLDDRLTTDMIATTVPYDTRRPLTWSVEWGGGVTFIGCENRVIATFDQAPTYALMLLIDVFDLSSGRGTYPTSAVLHHARAWSRDSH
ncbi:hypothetical protein D8Y23_06940 [Microbacterium enclense]|uniref:Uncharacterized protein n=2 Tax=Microbacterium enclense TaxID=993073 RepID=A0A3S3KZ49_9MICO|nr:hypothetical protein D8Y23_06940 [Microbacterium enclense]